MEKGERFESVYKFYTDGRKKFTELIRLKPTQVFCGGFFPPLIGSVAAIGIALVFHNDEISNYNWQCGRARLPSLSRIINLPLERTFWQLFILMHVPIRVVELFTGFSRYNRLLNVNYERKRLYHFMRYAYLLVGLAELFFLAALSIIGERENIRKLLVILYLCIFSRFINSRGPILHIRILRHRILHRQFVLSSSFTLLLKSIWSP
ncbi:hypothetical protein QR680_003271 [Steinernema hermaphroditum]|uniref:CWH43-like N-terminal domain-containing protein n=1 Tax=Steinernema hermaphroditum TaxID=289476 RepID=A0AA39H7X7_9BILA|nr:hypothetical protein QR680_003271 [Steinernema hermaphroditum]